MGKLPIIRRALTLYIKTLLKISKENELYIEELKTLQSRAAKDTRIDTLLVVAYLCVILISDFFTKNLSYVYAIITLIAIIRIAYRNLKNTP